MGRGVKNAVAPGCIAEGYDDGFGPSIQLWSAPDDSLSSDATAWIGSCDRHVTVLATAGDWALVVDAYGRVGWACICGNLDSGAAAVVVVARPR